MKRLFVPFLLLLYALMIWVLTELAAIELPPPADPCPLDTHERWNP